MSFVSGLTALYTFFLASSRFLEKFSTKSALNIVFIEKNTRFYQKSKRNKTQGVALMYVGIIMKINIIQ